jgi:MFS family permease
MQSTPTNDYSRKWWALAAVGSGTFMSTVDGSIVNIALNTIQQTYNASLGQAEWVVLAYLLGIVCLLPSMGRLGDMIGRRRVYMTGFFLFAFSSVFCGFAWDINSLVVFRLLQAVGAAMIQAMGVALLIQAFPASERGRALGYNATIISVGVASGPVLGGVMIESFGWRSIFLVNIPFSIIAIAVSYWALTNDTQRSLVVSTNQRPTLPFRSAKVILPHNTTGHVGHQ